MSKVPSSASSYEEQSLEALLSQVAEAKESALEALYDMTSGRSYGIALKILKSEPLAEEAALAGYVKIWQQAGQYQPRLGSAKVWIDILIRNCALDFLRKKSRMDRLERVGGHFSPQPDLKKTDPEALFFQSERARMLQSALASLSEAQRAPLYAAYFEGLTHQQIAEKLDLPIGTVKTRIRKGLQILRREIHKNREGNCNEK